MKGHYLTLAALVLALLLVCLPRVDAIAASKQIAGPCAERAAISAPVQVGPVDMGTQGDKDGGSGEGEDNEGDPDEWGEGNGVKAFGSSHTLDPKDGLASRAWLEDLRGWVGRLLQVLSPESR